MFAIYKIQLESATKKNFKREKKENI